MKRHAPVGRLRRGQQPVSRRATVGGLLLLAVVTAGFVQLAVLSYGVIRSLPKDASPQISSLKAVTVVGPEETVFDWSTQACEPRDIPDFPARAFRDSSGNVQLIAAHYVNRRAVGPTLGLVQHQCDLVLGSDFQANPSLFDDRQWLGSLYTKDGNTVYALVHNEYQGDKHPGRCATELYLECWYNAITLSRSTDGGRSYHQVGAPPAHLVGTIPYRYKPDSGFHGLFEPSNIVRRGDGYYYVLVHAQRSRRQQAGTCVMRTRQLARPSSWRAWDGNDYSIEFIDPYRVQAAAADHVCAPVSDAAIGGMSMSLTYNTYFKKYMLVSPQGLDDPATGRTRWGFYYSLSDDLIHWKPRKLIKQSVLLTSYRCGDPNPVYYPSILDPGSRSRNFGTAGQTPFLYFTRFHYSKCQLTLNRDLVRMRIRFSK